MNWRALTDPIVWRLFHREPDVWQHAAAIQLDEHPARPGGAAGREAVRVAPRCQGTVARPALAEGAEDGVKEHNPNHPVTRTLHDEWHKLCAIALFTLGSPELEITEADIAEFQQALGEGASIVADARNGRFVLRLVTGAEAEQLARQEGGLPS
jgi:hypothetical protein